MDDLNEYSDQPDLKKEIAEEIVWEAPEYEFVEKTKDWYWLLGTIAVLIIVISILFGNYLLALIIALGAFILGTQARRSPDIITYGLTRFGVKHGNTVFRYDTIRTFWIDVPRNNLIIESSRPVKPHIHIPLGDTEPKHIRDLMLTVAREEEYHGSFGDFVSDFFGL